MVIQKKAVKRRWVLADMVVHLSSRQLDITKYHITYTQDVCAFQLYTLTGSMVGYQ